ncbi:sll1863 family stress response protein [Crocosphaera chwakensis]|uniref:Coiled coil domain-containing protein n=1 Tax=Crocosphaera chwakensis CCY0110 TaxID=391612 RepID=A3IPL7_9CHRO|nr:hypothetical protein [Crocosphaera chwakensis]EAZ91507.1 hypothetical protein CY0110_13341 [Crocosphaera chwakensis CCY0110]
MATQTPANEQNLSKQAYEEKVKARLEKLNAQIDEMKAKAKQAKAETEIEYHSQIEELTAKRDAAFNKLEELQKSGEDAWKDIQAGFELAWKDLQVSFENATKKFQ